jgi:ketosteroid isomerase-like protein
VPALDIPAKAIGFAGHQGANRGGLEATHEVTDMSELDDFLSAVLPRQHHADTELHNGDAGPRKTLWSHNDPVTVLGAAKTVSGWPDVAGLFDWLAHNFSQCVGYDLDVSAAGVSGDLGYVVGAEHTTASVGGATPIAYALRVTLIFRREDGEWKEVHRHADPMPGVESTYEQLGRLR